MLQRASPESKQHGAIWVLLAIDAIAISAVRIYHRGRGQAKRQQQRHWEDQLFLLGSDVLTVRDVSFFQSSKVVASLLIEHDAVLNKESNKESET